MKLHAEGLEALPLEMRLLRYHEMREEASRLAETAASQAQRMEYIALSENWRLLADETERVLRELRPPTPST